MACRCHRLDPSRPRRGQGVLSRTPWLLAIVLLSLWQCLPSHGLTWLQLLCTIRVWTGECMERGPGALTPHVSIGVSICRHMRAALSLWLAQRSTWWLFPEAPPDLLKLSRQDSFGTPVGVRLSFLYPSPMRASPHVLGYGPGGGSEGPGSSLRA